MSHGPSIQGFLGGDPLVYEEHASPQRCCDLTAGLQEVSCVRTGETLK